MCERTERLRAMEAPLLAWYRSRARVLPWRENRDPYRIWVSEIMLQQTRVEAVKPYFERFMEAFPGVKDLAEAEDDRLMKMWEGLGYYSRARNLKAAARIIVDEYGGCLPASFDALKGLPESAVIRPEPLPPLPTAFPCRRWTGTCSGWCRGFWAIGKILKKLR